MAQGVESLWSLVSSGGANASLASQFLVTLHTAVAPDACRHVYAEFIKHSIASLQVLVAPVG